MEERIRNLLKQSLGFKDNDFKKLDPSMAKLFNKIDEIMSYKFIAEVIDSYYCVRNIKVGDKYVFINGVNLDLKESTAPFCLYAMPALAKARRIMTERIVEGLDPNGILVNSFECDDPGLERGGLGNVRMRVYCEKMD